MLSSHAEPEAFGVLDDTITTISAWSFSIGITYPDAGADYVEFSPSLSRFNSDVGEDTQYFATLDLPAGAVIDSIGVNTATDTDAVMGLALWQRGSDGSLTMLSGFSLPAHGWDTDFAGPLGILVDTHKDRQYILEVEQAASAHDQYFGWVEVWWHRNVSPAPQSPTFGDVPATDLGFQYIEALAASGITGGCGGGNYCPDASLTRRQMAIFLAKALGLHWPY